MDATELRLGNLVSTPDNDIHVWKFDKSDYDYYEMEEIKPIPLTKEKLIELGLKLSDHKPDWGYYGIIKGYELTYTNKDNKFTITLGGASDPARNMQKEIKYVHKLQNLYYELEDKELI